MQNKNCSLFNILFLLCLVVVLLSSCQKLVKININPEASVTVPDTEKTRPLDPTDQRIWKDISYANLSPSQKLDIYLPERGSGPFPVIISIHGGGLSEGDKVGPDLKASLNAIDRGYALVSINYRLLGEAKMPAQIMDVKAVIRFVRSYAPKYSFDPMKIALWGGSAGGYLASLAGTSSDIKEFIDPTLGNSDQSDRVQAVVDWYGPISDQRVMGLDPKYTANPESYITSDDPPFLIQHGKLDQLVSFEQSVIFAENLKKVLGEKKVELTLIDDVGHGNPVFFSPKNIKYVLDFLDLYMK
jgi:acetyl esterase/lipase